MQTEHTRSCGRKSSDCSLTPPPDFVLPGHSVARFGGTGLSIGSSSLSDHSSVFTRAKLFNKHCPNSSLLSPLLTLFHKAPSHQHTSFWNVTPFLYIKLEWHPMSGILPSSSSTASAISWNMLGMYAAVP